MSDLVDKLQSIKKKKLIVWGVRQLISACIIIPVVMKWPRWKWLIPVWIVLAVVSLVVPVVMFRRLEDKMNGLESKLAKLEDDDLPVDVIRTADEIARRALVLSSVISVAYGHSREQVLAWLRTERLLPELSPREQDFLATSEHSREDHIAFTWMIERLVPLLWSIQKIPTMPPLTAQCDTEEMKRAIVWPPASSRLFVENARLRPEDELSEAYEVIYEAHWRVRDAQLRGLPPPDGLNGESIYERHYGFNWVMGYCGQPWDEISTDT
jgi:hypothetical protein